MASTGGIVVSPGRLIANESIARGRRVELPTYKVTNGLNEDVEIKVSVSDYQDRERKLPPAGWFVINPTKLLVPAGKTRDVNIILALPKDASPGKYKVWFRFASEPLKTPKGGIANVVNLQVPFVFDVAGPVGGSEAVVGSENKKEPAPVAETATAPKETTRRENVATPGEKASSEGGPAAEASLMQAQNPTSAETAEQPPTENLQPSVHSQSQAPSGFNGPNRPVWAIGVGAVVVLAVGLVLRWRLAKR